MLIPLTGSRGCGTRRVLASALTALLVAACLAAKPSSAQGATLTVNIGGSGVVTSSPSGIDCPGMCFASFGSADTVTLTASTGLVVWQGACDGQTGRTCTVDLIANRVVGAGFASAVRPLPPPPPPPPPAPAPPPSPPPRGSLRDDLADIASKRRFASISFNTPPTLGLDDSAEIELLLSPEETVRELKRKLTAAGVQNGARVRYTARMLARMAGRDFVIEPITEPIQAVTRGTETRWIWQINPRREGTLYLRLTLSMLIRVEGTDTFSLAKSYRATLKIEVSALQRISRFIDSNWQWLWTAILVPSAAWFVSRQRRSRDKSPKGGDAAPRG